MAALGSFVPQTRGDPRSEAPKAPGQTLVVTRRVAAGAGAAAVAATALWRFGGLANQAETQTPPASIPAGRVIHTVFALSNGNADSLAEMRHESWRLVGLDGNIQRSRTRVTDRSGALDQEGFSDASRGVTVNVDFTPAGDTLPGKPPLGPIISTHPRAKTVRATMWTPQSVRSNLEAKGLRPAGDVTIAGVPGTRYEQRLPFAPEQGARRPAPASELRAEVRRAYVGRDPVGADLGEEHGYETTSGRFVPNVYRRLLLYEILESAPPGTFDWPHGFTEKVPGTRQVPREIAE